MHLINKYNTKNNHVSYASTEIRIYTLTTRTTKDEDHQMKVNPSTLWTLYVDGSQSKHVVGMGVTLANPHSDISSIISMHNNIAEYKALVLGLHFALDHGIENIQVYKDS